METDIISVSVTVPVYNTSKYLRKCLDSLAAQTLHCIEFILVDDGSTDNSGAICDEYAAKDHRFRVIHQVNGGLAVARQTGLDAAIGKYIIPCDSDDWVEPDMYEKLYRKAVETDADMVICGYIAEYDNGKREPHQKWFKHLDFEGHVKELFESSYNCSWCRLLKREIFTKNGIAYEPGVNLGEDWLILFKIMKTKPKIAQIDFKPYHYRKVLGSSSYTNQVTMSQIIKGSYTSQWIKANYDNEIFAEGLYFMNITKVFVCLRAKDTDFAYLNDCLTTLSWKDFFRFKKTVKSFIVYSSKLVSPKIMAFVVKALYKYVY